MKEYSILFKSNPETPSYTYYENLLDQQIDIIFDAIPEGKRNQVQIFFAFKACYQKEVVSKLISRNIGLEVMSPYELDLISKKKINVPFLSINGLGQREALNTSNNTTTFYTVDSYYDFEALKSSILDGSIVNWGMRIRVMTTSSATYSSEKSKLGLASEDEDYKKILAEISKNSKLKPNLIQAHVTINEKSITPYLEVISHFKEIVKLEEFSNVEFFNIGGGFDTDFKSSQFKEIFEFFFNSFSEKKIFLEPGRFLVNNTCIGVARVVSIKKTQGVNFIVLDAGTNALIPIPTSDYKVKMESMKTGSNICIFVDSILTAGNVIGNEYKLENIPSIGDIVLLENVGAYTHSMAAPWGYSLPSVQYKKK